MASFTRLAIVAATLCCAATLTAADSLDIYFIDVEGGQATLIATPTGESLLVDTGYGGNEDPDPTPGRAPRAAGGGIASGFRFTPSSITVGSARSRSKTSRPRSSPLTTPTLPFALPISTSS